LRDGLAALVTTASAAAACATVWWIAAATGGGPGAAVLATVIALSLARRTFSSRSEFARSAALLPVVGLAAAAVGWLLITIPPVGATLFVAGMSIPIWMRRFGPRAARLGALIALPLTAVLVAPVPPASGGPAWLNIVLVLAAGIVAAFWVAVARELLRFIPLERNSIEATAATERPEALATPSAPRAGRRLRASTRMAVQMAIALAAAFLVGWTVFPGHAMWVVLTAFLVCSGNRGRGDVLHKSALRILGALGGTVAAVALAALVPHASGFAAVVVIFVALFAGTWLRGYSYAFWALTVTLVLSLLQELLGVASLAAEGGLLIERMLAIVAGAALGIAASWFVLPVRSTDVLRRRLSEMLVALGAVLAPDAEDRPARVARFRASLARVEQLAPAHRARRLFRLTPPRRSTPHRALPIDCIEAATTLSPALDGRLRAARTQSADPADRERLRAAIRVARQSLAAPSDLELIHSALLALATALRGGSPA
jgi:hypothetical protein